MQKEEAVDQWPSAVQLLLAEPAGERAPVHIGHTCVCQVLASRPCEPVPCVPGQGDSWVLPAGVSEAVWSTRVTWAGICLSGTFCLLPQLRGLGSEAASRWSSSGALASAGWQPLQATLPWLDSHVTQWVCCLALPTAGWLDEAWGPWEGCSPKGTALGPGATPSWVPHINLSKTEPLS